MKPHREENKEEVEGESDVILSHWMMRSVGNCEIWPSPWSLCLPLPRSQSWPYSYVQNPHTRDFEFAPRLVDEGHTQVLLEAALSSSSIDAEFSELGQSWASAMPQASPQRQRLGLDLIWTHLIAPVPLCPIINFMVGHRRGGTGLGSDTKHCSSPTKSSAGLSSLSWGQP